MKKTKKILFISHSSGLTGGSEDDFERLLKYFSRKTEYEIFGLFPTGPREKCFGKYCKNYKTYRAFWFPFSYESIFDYVKYLYFVLLQYRQIYGYFKNKKYDLIVFNVGALPQFNIFFKLKKQKQTVFIRETIKPDTLRMLIYKLIDYCTCMVFTVSNKISADFTSKTKNNKNIYTVYSAVEVFSDHMSGDKIKVNQNMCNIVSSNGLSILHIGNITPIKNQELLVKALAYFDKNYKNILLPHIYFLGDHNVKPEYYNYLTKLINEYKLNDNISFLGRQNKESVFKNLDSSNILVITSKNEGLPLVISEAYQRKKPVISTLNGGVEEVIKSGENGFVINFSAKELAEKIKYYYDSDNLKLHSEKSFQLFNEFFRLENNLEFINNKFKTILYN